MNTNTQNNTQPLSITAQGMKSNFQDQLSDFFDFSDVLGHTQTITELCLAFTGATASIDRLRMDIADMVCRADKIREFIKDVEAALAQDDSCLDDCDVEALSNLTGVDGSAALIEILKWSLQCWIYFDDQVLSIDDVQDAAYKFQIISKVIEACNEINSRTNKQGGLLCA